MTYPSTDVITTNLDAATDSPASARTDLLDLATKFNLLRNHISAFWQTALDDPNSATALVSLGAAASGANADLTSLSALTAINAGPLAGNRNRVINGAGIVRQRIAVTATAALQYGQADRMLAGVIGGTAISGTIAASALAGTSTGQAWGLSSATWTTGVATFAHRIEAINTADLNGKTVTFSGKINHNLGATQSVSLTIGKANTSDNFSVTTTLATGSVSAASGAVTAFSLSVTLGASDATNGLELKIQYPSLSAAAKTLFNADWQIEIGAVATTYEQRFYPVELALCQRYFEKSYPLQAAVGTAWGSAGPNAAHGLKICAATARAMATSPFKIVKRTSPTLRYWDQAGNLSAFTVGNGVGNAQSNNFTADASRSVYADEISISAHVDASTVVSPFTAFCQWEALAEL